MEGADQINVRVKTLDGAEHLIELNRASSVSQLKSLIEEKTGIPPSGQRVIFQGRMLSDEISLNTAGVKDESVVHCVERAPPTPNTNQTAPSGSSDENNATRGQNRNRVRAQLERHVQQFVQSIALLGDQDQSSHNF